MLQGSLWGKQAFGRLSVEAFPEGTSSAKCGCAWERSGSQNVVERVSGLEIWLCYFLISPKGGESLEKEPKGILKTQQNFLEQGI